MEYVIVPLVALLAAALTLVSGFGLGTLLLPAFAIFFPAPVAVASTAVVHLATNLFKLGLVGRWAKRDVVIRFGIPALIAAFFGAAALGALEAIPALARYHLAGREHVITPTKLGVGLLVATFAMIELIPAFSRLTIPPRLMPVGGALSGFFGGLSGHQGALRTATLVKAGLTKQELIGTGNVCSVMVDVTRLATYAAGALLAGGSSPAITRDRVPLLALACACAFLGAFLGSRLLRKMTLSTVRTVIGTLLVASGLAMASGLI